MTKELSLYQITDEIKQVFELVTDAQGEVSEELELKIKEAESLLINKTDSCVGWRRSQEDLIAAIERRIDELVEYSKLVNSRLSKFDSYILDCMDRLDKTEFKGNLSTIKARKPSQAVEIENESLIPAEFIKIPEPKPIIMKAEIKTALKNGEKVDGARLIDGKKSLIFKVGV